MRNGLRPSRKREKRERLTGPRTPRTADGTLRPDADNAAVGIVLSGRRARGTSFDLLSHPTAFPHSDKVMKVNVNGKETLTSAHTVAELIGELNIPGNGVAVGQAH